MSEQKKCGSPVVRVGGERVDWMAVEAGPSPVGGPARYQFVDPQVEIARARRLVDALGTATPGLVRAAVIALWWWDGEDKAETAARMRWLVDAAAESYGFRSSDGPE